MQPRGQTALQAIALNFRNASPASLQKCSLLFALDTILSFAGLRRTHLKPACQMLNRQLVVTRVQHLQVGFQSGGEARACPCPAKREGALRKKSKACHIEGAVYDRPF